jgi:putative tryptophan/tyrosine transport system substrate-binding protein
MRRREFITTLGVAATWPFAAQPQQPAKVKRIAIVHPSEPVANLVASYHRFYHSFFNELGCVGYAEGNNLIVERYSAGGQPDRYAELARDVADKRPEAIYTMDSNSLSHLKLPRRRYQL